MKQLIVDEQTAAKAKEAILAYKNRYPNLNQESMPAVITHRQLSSGVKYFDTKMGTSGFGNDELGKINKRYTIENFKNLCDDKVLKHKTACHHINSGQKIFAPYVDYDSELKVLCFALATIDTNAEKSGCDRRLWKVVPNSHVFYMYNGQKYVYDNNGNHVNEGDLIIDWTSGYKMYERKGRIALQLNLLSRYLLWGTIHYDFVANAIYNFSGRKPQMIKGFAEHQTLNTIWQLGSWIEKKDPKTQSIKKEREISDIIETYKFDPITDKIKEKLMNMSKTPLNPNHNNSWCHRHAAIAKKFNDEDFGIITYRREDKYDYRTSAEPISSEIKENHIIYFINNKFYFIHKVLNDYEPIDRVNPIQVYENLDSNQIYNLKEILDVKKISYVKNLILPSENTICRIYQLIKHPEIESLMKIKLKNIALTLLDDNTINANEAAFFGIVNNKGKNIFQRYGMNKYQLTKIEELIEEQNKRPGYYQNHIAPLYIKESLTNINTQKTSYSWDSYLKPQYVDIGSYSNDVFDDEIKLMSSSISQRLCSWRRPWDRYYDAIIPDDRRNWNEGDNKEKNEAKHRQAIKYLHMAEKFVKTKEADSVNNVLRILQDTINLFKRFNNYGENAALNRVSWEFSKFEHLMHLHDTLIELENIRRREREAEWRLSQEERMKKDEERRKKTDEKRQQYEMTNGTYTIKLPDTLMDIVAEGSNLHHCVAGYVSRHAEGHTTILFLRKNDELDKSWFTIEVRNQQVVQIHGLNNQWLSYTDEGYETVPFVMKWLKEKNISCGNDILTSTCSHYSGVHINRELPEAEK